MCLAGGRSHLSLNPSGSYTLGFRYPVSQRSLLCLQFWHRHALLRPNVQDECRVTCVLHE
ncbi:Uncharacterised protein [Vibrio cholerae]|nr:Uncharacterised protein [Vibrio cholerae]